MRWIPSNEHQDKDRLTDNVFASSSEARSDDREAGDAACVSCAMVMAAAVVEL